MKKSLILLSMLALSVTAFAAKPTLPKSYTVRYTHNFGRIDGFVQIPKGGQFNTTSERRPTFDELNIKNILRNRSWSWFGCGQPWHGETTHRG